jgi:hypothetical protein
LPVFDGAKAVCGAESRGEVTGSYEAPGADDGTDGSVLAGWAAEVDTGAFEALGDDPLLEADACVPKQAVELAARDVVGGGEALRADVWFGEVAAGVDENTGEQGLLADLLHEASWFTGGGGDERA